MALHADPDTKAIDIIGNLESALENVKERASVEYETKNWSLLSMQNSGGERKRGRG